MSSDNNRQVDEETLHNLEYGVDGTLDRDAGDDLEYDADSDLERAVWTALRTVEDPELPVSIVDLGLVYDVAIQDGAAEIDLTLTYSGCPGQEMIVNDAAAAVQAVDGIDDATVTVVYSPQWSVDRITEHGRQKLGEFGLAIPGDTAQTDPDCHD